VTNDELALAYWLVGLFTGALYQASVWSNSILEREPAPPPAATVMFLVVVVAGWPLFLPLWVFASWGSRDQEDDHE
jgi:hypothetical protein